MKLYHASTVAVEHPDVSHSRPNLDFGRGFYLTDRYDQVLRYAERFTRRGKSAFVSEYELDENLGDFVVKRFEEYDEEWLDYVSVCRHGGTPEQKYDAVEGGVANDRVFNTVDLYFADVISKAEALGRLKYEKPNHQICILNEELMVSHFHFVKAESV